MTTADENFDLDDEDPPKVIPLAWLFKAMFKLWKRLTRK